MNGWGLARLGDRVYGFLVGVRCSVKVCGHVGVSVPAPSSESARVLHTWVAGERERYYLGAF